MVNLVFTIYRKLLKNLAFIIYHYKFMNYCSNCGEKVSFGHIEVDPLPRFYCTHCGEIHYQNPRVIIGCLPIWEDKVMLCKRGIEPQFGLWNLPGGFMENGENTETGALREVFEETGAHVRILHLHSVYSVVPVNQVHLHYLAAMSDLNYQLTPESTDIQMFAEAEIPWRDIAFTSNLFALKKYFEHRKNNPTAVHSGAYH